MNELRGVKLYVCVPGYLNGSIETEELERIAAQSNAHVPHEVRLDVDGGKVARIVRVYAKDGALYGDLEDVPPSIMDQLRAVQKCGAMLAVTLHLGDETK